MNDFGQFKIDPATKGFKGEKININNILNLNIILVAFKVGPSKFEKSGDRLDMQIIHKGVHRVTWICSKSLIEMIQRVPEDGFPFTVKIIKEDSGRMVFSAADQT